MIKIYKYGAVPGSEIFSRTKTISTVSGAVSEIIAAVRRDGDKALYDFTKKYDRVTLKSLTVSEEEIEQAFQSVDPALLDILRRAAENIREFHSRQLRPGFIINDRKGVVTGQKVVPIEHVGVYVPGGTAAYPSTVLMDTIPAVIAGCPDIAIATPPSRTGSVAPAILAAAKIVGINKIYKVGGAQAIAAFAYGTETVGRADKIAGPGNSYVAEAKRQVYGEVSIDMIAGPSEILIIADEKSNPRFVAADLLSQAEHDRLASAVLITDSQTLADKVAEELECQLCTLPREETARESIENNGKIIITPDIETAAEAANRIAPEHLELCVDNPFDYLDRIHNAGSIFMGRYCPEALGDYLAGPNHTLPTSGTARFSSPLSVDDFTKKMQYTYYTREALENVADDIARFAETEGLSAHARSATVRKSGDDKK